MADLVPLRCFTPKSRRGGGLFLPRRFFDNKKTAHGDLLQGGGGGGDTLRPSPRPSFTQVQWAA